ncbi:MAG: glycosyltransferase family 4 protein [Alphaproteobacteria bacterium]|jgi:glycosyltransferase involved in cell wall biosynthesis|nr:glycosyltransferase family 4 protein [Alphaproteobacteria bacterium]MBP9776936.1 glycosyltransferase family 4 protein [Alphaproteobacteria bacterium]
MKLKEHRKKSTPKELPQDLKVSHVFVSSFRSESRAIKEMRSLKKALPQADISFVGIRDDDQLSYELFEDQFEIFRENLKTRSLPKVIFFQLIKYLEWVLKAVTRLKKLNPKLIHCHSLGALPAAVIAKKYLKCSLIYDAHEFETERNGAPPFQRQIMRSIEKFFIRSTDEVLVVSPSIKDFYQKQYPKKTISLVVNAPSNSEVNATRYLDIRKTLGLSNKDFIFLYMGAVAKGRGIDLYMQAFKKLKSPFHLVFLCHENVSQEIRKIAGERDNIHWHPAVPHDYVINTIKQADVVIRILEATYLSYIYSLPNSVFQAEIAGIPYLVNDECKDIKSFFGCSPLCIPLKYDVNVLYNWCKNYTRESFPKREERADDIYIWETYEEILLNTYKNAMRVL